MVHCPTHNLIRVLFNQLFKFNSNILIIELNFEVLLIIALVVKIKTDFDKFLILMLSKTKIF